MSEDATIAVAASRRDTFAFFDLKPLADKLPLFLRLGVTQGNFGFVFK